jgi:glycosyltransferase involved in cell wall biosynthesis
VSKIAIVHDYFVQMGEAERVAAAMHESFPSAPVYATVALPNRLPNELRKANHYASRCRALLYPGEEDFGMVLLEVNAAGRPVIAYRAGSALETVLEGVTGLFFDRQEASSLANAIEEFESRNWLQPLLRQHAEKFDRKVFSYRLLQFLGSVAPSSCASDLLRGARLLAEQNQQRAWPRLAVARETTRPGH